MWRVSRLLMWVHIFFVGMEQSSILKPTPHETHFTSNVVGKTGRGGRKRKRNCCIGSIEPARRRRHTYSEQPREICVLLLFAVSFFSCSSDNQLLGWVMCALKNWPHSEQRRGFFKVRRQLVPWSLQASDFEMWKLHTDRRCTYLNRQWDAKT